MALINCPDCKNQISDSADKCIHCGRPMRLSRESILAEIRNLEVDRQRQFDLLDYVANCENYSPDHSVMTNNAFDRITAINERIKQLEAMMK